jgi:hypothetical protein
MLSVAPCSGRNGEACAQACAQFVSPDADNAAAPVMPFSAERLEMPFMS